MTDLWQGRRVLVTGANGFIGAWLCRKLVGKGCETIALVHKGQDLLEEHGIVDKVKLVQFDISNSETVAKVFSETKPEVCIHLAAKSSTKDAAKDMELTQKVNVEGTVNLLEAAKETECAFVFVSTVKVYGGSTDTCFSEEQEPKAESEYGKSKVRAEAKCVEFAKQGVSVVIARPSAVFGAHENRKDRMIMSIINSLRKEEKPVMGKSGENALDFVYISDVLTGLMMLAEKAMQSKMSGEIFNLGLGEGHSLKEISEKIAEIMGKDIETEFTGKEKPVRECLCIEKAKRELGWEPVHSIEEGLERTITAPKTEA